MKKSLLVLLLAGLLLVSVTACGSGEEKESVSESSSITETTPDDASESESESDTADSASESETTENGNSGSEIDQTEADFKDISMNIIVYKAQATVRTSPSMGENYAMTAYRGDIFAVTGESTHWYRISFKAQESATEPSTFYIAKGVAGNTAVVDAFVDGTPVTMVTTGNLNLRTFPSAEDDSTLTTSKVSLPEGTRVVCVAEKDGWTKIYYQNVKDGDEKEETYYVSSHYLKAVDTEADSETSTQAADEA